MDYYNIYCKLDRRGYIFRVYLVGDSKTGKSSIISRIDNKAYSKIYKLKNNLEYHLEGEISEDYLRRPQFSTHFPYLDAFLILFDKTNRECFDRLDLWIEACKLAYPNRPIMIVGTKSDMISAVSTEEAQEKAFRYQILYFDVSKERKEQIATMIDLIMNQILQKKNKRKKI